MTGHSCRNADIVNHMIFLMLAAHDTLTSSFTSLTYRLAAHPDWQEKVRAELSGLGIAANEPLPFDRLDDLPLAEMAFKEAMRLAPPVPRCHGEPYATLNSKASGSRPAQASTSIRSIHISCRRFGPSRIATIHCASNWKLRAGGTNLPTCRLAAVRICAWV
jgi:Cytochrome P450